MQLLKTAFHPDVSPSDILNGGNLTIVERLAARGIVLKNEDILLLYTQRYDDYSLPGGGIDDGEDNIAGLVREMKEETGAAVVSNVSEFGQYDEYRPWYKNDADIIYMKSFCYVCDVEGELGKTALESYEINNGMKPVWVNVHCAIAHNEGVLAHSDKKGLSIERETFLLRLIVERLLRKS